MEELLNKIEGKVVELKTHLESHLEPEAARAAMELIQKSHAQASAVVEGKGAQIDVPELSLIASHLDHSLESPVQKLAALDHGKHRVLKDGGIFGDLKYEALDPGWILSAVEWLAHYNDIHPFKEGEVVIQIPDDTTLAICGDWGSGYYDDSSPVPAQKVAKQMASQAYLSDYAVHLGDVYYSGSKEEERDNFVNIWPGGKKGSFTLNSNHEMYSGANYYFTEALADPKFSLQQGTSYFALVNSHWVIVGLDSAYDSSWKGMYQDGKLNAQQMLFLRSMKERHASKKFIILSHHLGYDLKGANITGLYKQVVLSLGGKPPEFWYWGHAHNAAVYKEKAGMMGRCTGHGAIMYGAAPELQDSTDVAWWENRNARDPVEPVRVLNGFTRVTLSGASLKEEFIDENGSVAWSNSI